MDKIRIFIVDDHNLFREGLCRLLESTGGFSIVGQCGTALEAIAAIAETATDVVLLDFDLGEDVGSGLIYQLRKQQPGTKILMVTAGMTETTTLQVMEAGACGVFLKRGNPEQLLLAIQRVAAGEVWLDSEAVRSLITARSSHDEQTEQRRPLTVRQSEVMRWILDGLTNKEIAWKLNVSESSIKAVIQELFHKAGVRTRSQLVRIAIEKHSVDWLRPKPTI